MSATNERIHDLLVLPYLKHPVRMYAQSYARRDDIDAAMRFGCDHRDALAARHGETGDRLHRSADLLERYVPDGRRASTTTPDTSSAPTPDTARSGLLAGCRHAS